MARYSYNLRSDPQNPTGASLPVKWEVIAPEGTTNLFLNPSWETNTSNWTNTTDGSGGTPYTRATTYQFKGAYSAVMTIRPTNGTYVQIVNNITMSTSTQYSMQFHVRRANRGVIRDTNVRAYVNGGLTDFDRIVYVANGWYRCEKTWLSTTTSGVGIRLVGSPGQAFYVDAAQLETKGYCTTYCDGDQPGLLPVEVPPPFYWTGTPHASSSVRTATTRAGGRPLDVSRYGLEVKALIGFGFSQRSVISTPLGLADGSQYQRTIRDSRVFTIAGMFEGSGPRDLSARRGKLRSLLTHDLSGVDQPVMMRLQRFDNDIALGDQVVFAASYIDGLSEEMTQPFDEAVSIQFEQYIPGLPSASDRAATLDTREEPTIAYVALRNRNTGVWSGLGSLNAVPQPNAILFGPDGALYVGGAFTSPGTRVARYSFAAGAWETLSTGLGAQVNALAFDPSGTLYAGLNSAVTIGPNTGSVASWNGSAWSIIASAPSDRINALAYDPFERRLYTGGTTGGNATLRYWNGSAWTAVSTGTAGTILDLAFDPVSGLLYFSGTFSNLNGDANIDNVGAYTGSALTALSTGSAITVNALALQSDGTLYLATGADYQAWNGTSFQAMGGLTGNSLGGTPTVAVDQLTRDVWATSDGAGSVTATSSARPLVIWRNANNISLPAALFIGDANAINGIAFNPVYVAVSYGVSGTFPAAGLTAVANPGTVPVPMKIIFRGGTNSTGAEGQDGFYQILNWTTGQRIDLNFVVFKDEVVTLDTTNLALVSNVRGQLNDAIGIGSNAPFLLAPGTNQIFALSSDPTRPITADLVYTPQYESLDDATMTPALQ